MNYLGLTVFAGNTPGLILDFDPTTKEYTVEFTDGRVVKTAKVYWDKTIPSEPDIAFYRQSSVGNGEYLVYDPEIGWDVISAIEDGIDIVDEPSDLGEWVGEYKGEEDRAEDHSDIKEKLNEVLDVLNDVREKVSPNDEETDPIQDQDHDATEDSYWDRTLKPNPMAMDNEFGSGSYNERNDGALPGGRAMAAKVAKDCGCWDGYKRVPGTKPCAPGSCEKCDGARKESAAKKKKDVSEAVNKVNTVPPAGVRAAAKRGLKYYDEGKAGDGFEAATADRARKIAAGEALTEEHINRMHSFFERHAGGRSKKAKPGEVTAWDVAWLCWGGDPGRSWAAKVDAQLHKARHPNSKGKHSADAGAGVFDFVNNEDDTDHMRSDIGDNSTERLLQKSRDLMTPDGQDYDGNPEMEFDEGGDEGETGIDRHVVHLDGVDLNTVDPEDESAAVTDFGDLPEPPATDDEGYEVDEDGEVRHSHVRSEAAWEDKRFSSGIFCPVCSDPLVNYNCHSCGESRKKFAKRVEKNRKQMNKITKALTPKAAELGTMFGRALAGYKQSVTEPSEDIFTVHVDGQDSDPSIGGTGGYNMQHGDSPEYLKDIVGENSAFIDPTPTILVKALPKAQEMADSDKENTEIPKEILDLVDSLEKILPKVFGENVEKAKKDKESSLRLSGTKTGNEACAGCGRTDWSAGRCALANPEQRCAALSIIPGGQYPPNSPSDVHDGGNSVNNTPTQPMGVQYSAPGSVSPVSQSWSTGGRQASVEYLTDDSGDPVAVGQTYRVVTESTEAPKIVEVTGLGPESVTVAAVDPSSPEGRAATYDISAEKIDEDGVRFENVDSANPVELGKAEVDPLDGTPETMDDAGVGQNDSPAAVTDLSHGRGASVKEARRHYLPNQQREFINEPGKARNLDKLVLEGTHYVDNETTASENFDDDFLFGV